MYPKYSYLLTRQQFVAFVRIKLATIRGHKLLPRRLIPRARCYASLPSLALGGLESSIVGFASLGPLVPKGKGDFAF